MTETTSTETDANVVTDERAEMLAKHATYVQGGYSDAATERARAEAQLADSPGSIDWVRMQVEVHEALRARMAATATPLPATAPKPDPAVDPSEPRESQRVDVTAVLANIDQGEALRDRIKALQAELKVHEDMVKDALGNATAGTDASGKIVVRYPFRNRSGLSKEKVKAILSDEQYAECETVTEYRSLLYGAS
jgi:hypothetical protein